MIHIFTPSGIVSTLDYWTQMGRVGSCPSVFRTTEYLKLLTNFNQIWTTFGPKKTELTST